MTITKAGAYAIKRAKGYTDKTTIENYLLTSIDSSFDSQINDWIAGVEAYIEGETGRVFIADVAPTRRAYDGDGETDVLIDDCVEVTKLETGTDPDDLTEVEATEYFTGPKNAIARGKPITSIEFWDAVFSCARRSVHVTARWGYSETVPEDIKLAATILIAGIINFSNKVDGEIKQMTVGRYSVTYKDAKGWEDLENVKTILDRYRVE